MPPDLPSKERLPALDLHFNWVSGTAAALGNPLCNNGGYAPAQEARVALGYLLEQLLRFFRVLQTCRVHP